MSGVVDQNTYVASRDSQRQSALGGASMSRMYLARPELRQAYEQQQAQIRAFEADQAAQEKAELARRTSAKGNINKLSRKDSSGKKISGTVRAEDRLASFVTSFSRSVEPLAVKLDAERAKLDKAISTGDALTVRDSRERIRQIEDQLNQRYLAPDVQKALDLAKDYTYYIEDTGKGEQWFGADSGKQSVGEKLGTVFGKSYQRSEQRKDYGKRMERKLSDTSTMAFRSAYRDKYGADPVNVKIIDKRGRETSLAKLGRGYTPEIAKKVVDAQAAARETQKQYERERKSAITDTITDLAMEQYRQAQSNAASQGKTVEGGFGFTVSWDAQGNPVDKRGNPLLSVDPSTGMAYVTTPSLKATSVNEGLRRSNTTRNMLERQNRGPPPGSVESMMNQFSVWQARQPPAQFTPPPGFGGGGAPPPQQQQRGMFDGLMSSLDFTNRAPPSPRGRQRNILESWMY